MKSLSVCCRDVRNRRYLQENAALMYIYSFSFSDLVQIIRVHKIGVMFSVCFRAVVFQYNASVYVMKEIPDLWDPSPLDVVNRSAVVKNVSTNAGKHGTNS
jgi:hypothetical protein